MNRRRLVALLLPVALAVTVLGSRAAPAQTITPPIAYQHVATLGQTGQPYRRSDANLNQPTGLGADRDGVWIATGAGRNLLRFGLTSVESLGRAGALDALYGRPVRFLADVAVVNLWGGRPSPTATPRTGGGRVVPPTRTLWFVDQGGHVAVGLSSGDERFPPPPIVLGETDQPGDDDGHLRGPTGIAADSVGNVFVSDTGNHRVQVFAPDGKHLATIGQTGRAGAGLGQLDHPQRLTLSSDGRLYVADTGNHRVVAYDVSDPRAPRELRVYGQTGVAGAGPGQFDHPGGVAVDATFLYVADTGNSRVQVLTWRDGRQWLTLDGATRDRCGFLQGADPDWGPPSDLALDQSNNLYIAMPQQMRVAGCDAMQRVQRRDLDHGSPGSPYFAADDLFNAPAGIAVAADGSLAIVEQEGQRLVRIAADLAPMWIIGTAGVAGTGDAAGPRLAQPTDAVFLPDGRVVVSDTGNGRLQVFNAAGLLVATWGSGWLQSPTGLVLLPDGRLAVADSAAGRVRLLDAGGAAAGDLSGPAGPLAFTDPADVAVDSVGNWYVSERSSHVVQVFDRGGIPVRRVGDVGLSGDDFGHLKHPTGLAIDAADRLLVVDSGHDRVQVFAPDGAYLTTIGGRRGGGTGGLLEPHGIALAPDGKVYVADSFNHRVQVYQAATEPWLPAATDGFGDRATTEVDALQVFDGRLYAGIGGSTGAGVWRRDAQGPWHPVAAGGFGDAAHHRLRAFGVFGGMLYAGTDNRHEQWDPNSGLLIGASTGGAVWRSGDGERWEPVVAGGFGDAHQGAVGPFADFRGQLYAGTSTVDSQYPPQLWRSASGDGASWRRIGIGQTSRSGWSDNRGVSAMAAYSNSLYLGTCGQRAQLWSSRDGDAWEPAGDADRGVEPPAVQPTLGAGAPCVTSLAVFGGRLFAALGSPADRLRQPNEASVPAELWYCLHCDGGDWDQAAAPGFGDPANVGALVLAAFTEPPFDYLYAAVGNAASGLQMWRAPDGLDWEPLVNDGFGDDNNAQPGGPAAMAEYRGRLFVGTVNGANGGELWSTGGTRPQLLPPAAGPTVTPTPRPRPQPPVGRARYRQVDAWPVEPALPDGVLGGITDMAVAADGAVYLLADGPPRLLHLRSDGAWAPDFGASGTGPGRLSQPRAIAVDDAVGRVYVADVGGQGRLVAYDLQGGYVATVSRGARPVDVQVLPDGTLWLADLSAGGLRHLAADGTELARFGHFGPEDEDGFLGLAAVAVEPRGLVWAADQGGARLRAYALDAGGRWARVATLDLTRPNFAGCDGRRLQALGDDVLLAGACIIAAGARRAELPADQPGSDIYAAALRSANPAAGMYYALASLDTDRGDPANPTAPVLVRYVDERFTIVLRYWLGRATAGATSVDNQLQQPVRIDALPNGDVVVTDSSAFFGGWTQPPFTRRFHPDGRPIEKLAIRTRYSNSFEIIMDGRLAFATGESGRIAGVATLRSGCLTCLNRPPLILSVVAYAQSIAQRVCHLICIPGLYLDPIWKTSLINLQQQRAALDYNYAAAFDAFRRQVVLLQVWADSPSDAAMPARLLLMPLDAMGRKTEVALDGTEREALWTDVDVGPDGRIHALDTLNDRLKVFDGRGALLAELATPKDAWKLAGGPNGETFLLTTHGQVVRLAPDGQVLSRFSGLPDDTVPTSAVMDLAVDAWGRVYTIDEHFDQVTVFEPDGSEADVLEGEDCHLAGDKWVAPDELLLGDSAALNLTLFGTCGYVEEPTDIVLAVNAETLRMGPEGTYGFVEPRRLRVARQILGLVDLDVHRVGIVSFVLSGQVDRPLTHERRPLIQALFDLPGGPPLAPTERGCAGVNNDSALKAAREAFADSPPGRRKVLILIAPGMEPRPGVCPWTALGIARSAAELKAGGVEIVAVNGASVAASSQALSGIAVAERGQGVGRPALQQALSRRWPTDLMQSGTLTDTLPANMDYVLGSASPPADWDAATRTLSWRLGRIERGLTPRFSLKVRPREEGLWPTNVSAVAEGIDGWGDPFHVVLPVPRVRVYGELPPTATSSATPAPTATLTATPEPTATPRPTLPPKPIYLPILPLTAPCRPETRNADIALVIDSSSSMTETTRPGGPTKLAAAQEAARAFLAQLAAVGSQAALIQFSNTAAVLVPLTPDIAAVTAGLDRLTQASGTRIDLALDSAVAELTGSARRAGNNPVIILLTDGEPTGTTTDAVQQAALRAKTAGMLVFTIGLGQAVDRALLSDIASRPEWAYFAPDTSDLAGIYERIVYVIPCRPEWP